MWPAQMGGVTNCLRIHQRAAPSLTRAPGPRDPCAPTAECTANDGVATTLAARILPNLPNASASNTPPDTSSASAPHTVRRRELCAATRCTALALTGSEGRPSDETFPEQEWLEP